MLSRWWARAPHEVALLTVAAITTFALAIWASLTHASWILCAMLIYASTLLACPWDDAIRARVRLFMSYVMTLTLYLSIEWITPALGAPLRDDVLLQIDRAVLGQTPAEWLEPYMRPWLTDIMSAGYLSYHPYLHTVLLMALAGPIAQARRLGAYIFTTFAVGILGYLLVPAVGPLRHLNFTTQPEGSWITKLNHDFISTGTSVFDVFPSWHVMITCALLHYDFQHHRIRFYIMAPVAVILCTSTLYLRYHYAVDVVAGVALAALAAAWFSRSPLGQDQPGTDQPSARL